MKDKVNAVYTIFYCLALFSLKIYIEKVQYKCGKIRNIYRKNIKQFLQFLIGHDIKAKDYIQHRKKHINIYLLISFKSEKQIECLQNFANK